jgi:voltage-gated potassium channel Kch
MAEDESGGSAERGEGREAFVIIAGFGLPGRSLVELLRRQNIKYIVVEKNPQTTQRVVTGGVEIVEGDAADLETLRKAGAERATLVALMVPNDEVVLAAVAHVRQMNSFARIIARCAFTSTGLEAMRRGADEIVVAEQVVARELLEVAGRLLAPAGGG